VGINSARNAELPEILVRLGRDHARINSVVQQLSHALDPLSGDLEDINWVEIAGLINFLKYFADRVHHPLEDRLFDKLLHKGLTPVERHIVFGNMGQHQELAVATERLCSEVQIALDGGAVDNAGLVDLLTQYVALQTRHMRFEEVHLLPLLIARFDDEDWTNLTLDPEDQAYE
jgi:hemerythrin-like domain-containing protein